MKADTKAEREFMEQKKNKLLSDMIQNDTDKKMVQLVEAATDLSCGDICTLLEVAHSLPFVGNLEGGDKWIGFVGVESISGSYFNVMGLPIQRLYRELKQL